MRRGKQFEVGDSVIDYHGLTLVVQSVRGGFFRARFWTPIYSATLESACDQYAYDPAALVWRERPKLVATPTPPAREDPFHDEDGVAWEPVETIIGRLEMELARTQRSLGITRSRYAYVACQLRYLRELAAHLSVPEGYVMDKDGRRQMHEIHYFLNVELPEIIQDALRVR